MSVAIVPIDPYHETNGLMFPLLLQRIRAYGDSLSFEVEGDVMAQAWGTRLMARDPSIMAVAFCLKGKMIGHAVATFEQLMTDRWVFIQQCRLDPKVDAGDAVARAIAMAKEWGRSLGATRLMYGTHRSDAAWVRKHGAKVIRHVMYWPIEAEVEEGAEVA